MPNMKRMAGGGNISELSDSELNRLSYAAQDAGLTRGMAKVRLEGHRRRRASNPETTKRTVYEDMDAKELEDALARGAVSPGLVGYGGGGMKQHKVAEYKKGGAVKKMASGGRVRGDGCAIRGKTKGKVV